MYCVDIDVSGNVVGTEARLSTSDACSVNLIQIAGLKLHTGLNIIVVQITDERRK